MKKQKWIAWAMAAMLTMAVPMQAAAAMPEQADAGGEVTEYSDLTGSEALSLVDRAYSVTDGDDSTGLEPEEGEGTPEESTDTAPEVSEGTPEESTDTAPEVSEGTPDGSTGAAPEESEGTPDGSTGSVTDGDEGSIGDGGSVSDGDEDTDLSGKVVNLAFVIDTTGSMSGYIQGIVDNLKDFVKYIENTGVTFRLSLIEYRDITVGEESVVHTFDHSVWSKSTEEFSGELNALVATGGGDQEETLVDALGYLVDESVMTFNSSAAKFAVVLTDAPYKTDNIHGIASMEEMTSSLAAKGIHVSVMTPDWYFSHYEDLTEKTGGILCPVDDFSSALKKYAREIIRATADSDIEEEHQAVKSIRVEGPGELQPNYVYSYRVAFEPENAYDKGVYWYIEDSEIAQIISAKGDLCYIRGIKEGTTKLTAVSRDGGYTSEMELKILADAGTEDAIIAFDFESVRALLGNDTLKRLEYRVMQDKEVTKEEQKEIFTSLKGTDKNFSFTFVDGEEAIQYKWSFEGSDITDENIGMNFGIGIGVTGSGAVGDLDEGGKQLGLRFGHEGGLPGKATVTTAVGDYFTTSELYLYYFNPETQSFELAAEKVPVKDGYATFPLAHCSDYILTSEMLRSLVPVKQQQTDKNDDNSEDGEETVQPVKTASESRIRSPKTGEPELMTAFVFLCTATAGLFCCGRRLKGKKR